MPKVIVEVGSTVTKIDKIVEEKIEHLEDITILFKKNYKKEKQLAKNDVETLIEKVNQLKKKNQEVKVCRNQYIS